MFLRKWREDAERCGIIGKISFCGVQGSERTQAVEYLEDLTNFIRLITTIALTKVKANVVFTKNEKEPEYLCSPAVEARRAKQSGPRNGSPASSLLARLALGYALGFRAARLPY